MCFPAGLIDQLLGIRIAPSASTPGSRIGLRSANFSSCAGLHEPTHSNNSIECRRIMQTPFTATVFPANRESYPMAGRDESHCRKKPLAKLATIAGFFVEQ